MSRELENKELQNVSGGISVTNNRGNITIRWKPGERFDKILENITYLTKGNPQAISTIKSEFDKEDKKSLPHGSSEHVITVFTPAAVFLH